MPDLAVGLAVGAAITVAVIAIVGALALVCSTNTVDEEREMRFGSRISERALRLGDRQIEISRERHYADMDAMARARARGDENIVEMRPRPASPRGGWAA